MDGTASVAQVRKYMGKSWAIPGAFQSQASDVSDIRFGDSGILSRR
jgi:hypothetical protein